MLVKHEAGGVCLQCSQPAVVRLKFFAGRVLVLAFDLPLCRRCLEQMAATVTAATENP